MVRIDHVQLLALAPSALPMYREALSHANFTLVLFGILNNRERATHFLAQVLHESGGLTRLLENLNYTTPERIVQIFKSRIPTVAEATQYVRNPEKLANKVYGGRADLGNTEPGDGWKFPGRGMIQLTGKLNYHRIGRALDADFVSNPSLVIMPEYVVPAAAEFWRQARCNAIADTGNITAVTRAINGGLNGLADRISWHAKVQAVVKEVTWEP